MNEPAALWQRAFSLTEVFLCAFDPKVFFGNCLFEDFYIGVLSHILPIGATRTRPPINHFDCKSSDEIGGIFFASIFFIVDNAEGVD